MTELCSQVAVPNSVDEMASVVSSWLRPATQLCQGLGLGRLRSWVTESYTLSKGVQSTRIAPQAQNEAYWSLNEYMAVERQSDLLVSWYRIVRDDVAGNTIIPPRSPNCELVPRQTGMVRSLAPYTV